MISNNTHPTPSIRLINNTYYLFVVLLLCALSLFANPSSANENNSSTDNNEDNLVEGMDHKNTDHIDMRHDDMKHSNIEHDNMKHDDMEVDEMKHGDMDHNNMVDGHGHTPVDVSDWPTTPSLTLTAYRDAMAGWNLHIEPVHFVFAPDQVNEANVVGKGHAHLYVNGKKITRLYASWYYLNNLHPGIHSVTVSLNANNHGPLVLHNQHISATIELVQE